MVSALAKPPHWLKLYEEPARAARLLGKDPYSLQSISREEYCAYALRRIFEAALAEEDLPFIDYKDLSPRGVLGLAEILGLPTDDGSEAALEKVFALDAKSVQPRAFEDDTRPSGDAEGLPDPIGEPIEAYRKIVPVIRHCVDHLILHLKHAR